MSWSSIYIQDTMEVKICDKATKTKQNKWKEFIFLKRKTGLKLS